MPSLLSPASRLSRKSLTYSGMAHILSLTGRGAMSLSPLQSCTTYGVRVRRAISHFCLLPLSDLYLAPSCVYAGQMCLPIEGPLA